ncbi:MAG: hypothetical protein BGO12_23950 [Verrucomicrobia bacterium 61-8]|nr:DUF2339 domain-containing protein [Verrucomicrobiota bacterium]OJV23703.1 MAG: hypothetical protein BGO12_23950 [Verrucomicrobia bacterium 61-8]
MDKEIAELRARVERLERMAGLTPPAERSAPAPTVEPAKEPVSPPPEPIVAPSAFSTPPPLPTPPSRPETAPALRFSEAWLARTGIVLLLIGGIFFLKLSLDRGWITPLLQLAIAVAACLGLMTWGFLLSRKRPELGDLAFGGGIAGLVGVWTCGQYLYHLYPGSTTIVLSLLTAAICLAQALRQNSRVLCTLAILGIFISPLFIGLDQPGLFAIHATVITIIVALVFLRRGWLGALFIGVVTAGLLLYGAAVSSRLGIDHELRPGLQAALLFWWLALWLAPVARYQFRGVSPAPVAAAWFTSFTPALLAAGASLTIWGGDARHAIGIFLLVAAILCAVLGRLLAISGSREMANCQQFGAAILAGVALPVLLSGWVLSFAFAAFIIALHFTADRSKNTPLTVAAILASAAGLVFFVIEAVQLSNSGGILHVLSSLGFVIAITAAAFTRPDGSLKNSHQVAAQWMLVFWFAALCPPGIIPWSLGIVLASIAACAGMVGFPGGKALALKASSHILLVLVLIGAALHLMNSGESTPWVNGPALAMLFTLGAAAFLALRSADLTVKAVYLWIVLAGTLFLLSHEFAPIGRGTLVSISWTVVAVALIVSGIVRDIRLVRIAGICTLVLVLARLFTVDLASLDLPAKTLVFLGIGILLFSAGYFLPKFLPRENPPRKD